MKFEIKFVPEKRPYHVDIHWNSSNDWNSAVAYKWCEENFGHRNDKYDNPRWYANTRYFTGDFKFRDEQDAMLFMLRWS